MEKSRRQFLTVTSAGLIGAAAVRSTYAQTPEPQQQPTPGTPPSFGTGRLVGPDISPTTVSEAEKLVQVKMTDSEVAVAASSWRRNMAALYERRTGPRKVELEATLAPATKWNPVLAEVKRAAVRDRFIRSTANPGIAARERRRHCLCAVNQTLAVDRATQSHFDAAHAKFTLYAYSSSIPSCDA